MKMWKVYDNNNDANDDDDGKQVSEKNVGHQAFNEHSADKLVVAYNLKYEVKNWSQWGRDIGQNIQILVKKHGWFYSNF